MIEELRSLTRRPSPRPRLTTWFSVSLSR